MGVIPKAPAGQHITQRSQSDLGWAVGPGDDKLLEKIVEYMGCGRIHKASKRPNEASIFVVKIKDLLVKILPFFQSYPLQGVKRFDYRDFSEIAKIMEDKSHLTPEGLKKIKSLKSGMNTGRIDF